MDASGIAVWCALDVAKEEQHACTLGVGGGRSCDRAPPEDEARFRAVLVVLLAHGKVPAV